MPIWRAKYRLEDLLTTRGDIAYRAATLAARLAAGASGKFLKMGTDDPAWANAYLIDLLTADGDIAIRSSGAPARLAKGSDGEYLKLVSGLPAWAAVASKSIATGNYTGDGNNDRQITTGFKCSLVILWCFTHEATNQTYIIMPVKTFDWLAADALTEASLHATDGFVVNGTIPRLANNSGDVFYYWAISE